MDKPQKKSPQQKQAEATAGIAAYRASEAANYKNMLRLREERLAREAAGAQGDPAEGAKPKGRKTPA